MTSPRIRNKGIRLVRVADIEDNPLNFRTHSEAQRAAFAGIETELGFYGYPDVYETEAGTIRLIDGQLRKEHLLSKYGPEATIEVNMTDFDEDEAKKALLTHDPLSAMAEADKVLLDQLLREVDTGDEALQQMMTDLADEAGLYQDDSDATEIEEDEVPEPPVDPITKPGNLWILGEHRLLCGDSTKAEDVGRLMAGGRINVAFTSPPYASQRKYDESSGFKPIKPDDFVKWFEPIAANVKSHLAADGSWFVNIKEHCEDGQRSLYVKDLAIAHVRQWAWMLVDEFVWKRKGVPGGWENRFKNEWEPVFHFAKQTGIKFRKTAVGKQSQHAFTVSDRSKAGRESVFDCNADNGKEFHEGLALPGNVVEVNGQTIKEHNAAFPVGLPVFFIKAFTDKSDAVYEPFCGSGSTLIAAEQLNRKCYGMEISPQYCDVIVKRWENLTGKKAVLEGSK